MKKRSMKKLVLTRGIGWRGRWEEGSGWGIHVYPWLIHVNVWQKPLQYCKVISLQLIKKQNKQQQQKRKTNKSKSGARTLQNNGGSSELPSLHNKKTNKPKKKKQKQKKKEKACFEKKKQTSTEDLLYAPDKKMLLNFFHTLPSLSFHFIPSLSTVFFIPFSFSLSQRFPKIVKSIKLRRKEPS